MIRTKREDLLHCLEAVQPGLSARDIVQQSSCFVFHEGEVFTYNGEVSCRTKCALDLKGAVPAIPLLALLNKMPEDDVELEVSDGELIVHGKNRRAGIRMEDEILLPIDSVDKPGKWSKLDADYSDAVFMVGACASKDTTSFALTCIHIHPKWLEASDNFQIARYKIPTGVKTPILVKRDALMHMVNLDMTKFSQTENWIHFRNPTGLVLSCLQYQGEYHNVGPMLKVEGSPTKLPAGIADATEKAEIFSGENDDNNQVLVKLQPGKITIKGQGASGWYTEVKRLKYSGDELSFLIAPKLLIDFIKRNTNCEVTPELLKMDGGKFVYVTCLSIANEKKKEKKK